MGDNCNNLTWYDMIVQTLVCVLAMLGGMYSFSRLWFLNDSSSEEAANSRHRQPSSGYDWDYDWMNNEDAVSVDTVRHGMFGTTGPEHFQVRMKLTRGELFTVTLEEHPLWRKDKPPEEIELESGRRLGYQQYIYILTVSTPATIRSIEESFKRPYYHMNRPNNDWPEDMLIPQKWSIRPVHVGFQYHDTLVTFKQQNSINTGALMPPSSTVPSMAVIHMWKEV